MKRTRLFAWLTVAATLLLLGLGNVVTSTESGLGCGDDWPGCNGELIPDLTNIHVVYEFSHRVLAAIVTIFALLATVFAWRGTDGTYRPMLRSYSITALFVLVIQIILGAVTVRLELPPQVVFVHLGVSMAFFALMVALAWFAHEGVKVERGRSSELNKPNARINSYATGLLTLVYLQILLGGFVRHSGAALICPDIPLCQGALLPAVNELVVAHVSHRLLAILIAFFAFLFVFRAKAWGSERSHVKLIQLIAGLVVLQILWGAISIFSVLSPVWTTLHLMTAGAILALLVILIIQTRHRPAAEGLTILA